MNIRAYSRLLGGLGVIVVIVAIVVGGNFYRQHHAKAAKYTVVEACNYLTPTIARQVGGNSLEPQAIRSTSTDTDTTTYCVFRGSSTSVTLVARSARNARGATLNRAAFASPPGASQVVRGYGDTAYWSSSFKQLNVLKGSTWYILSSGSDIPADRTLAESQKLADIVIPRLP